MIARAFGGPEVIERETFDPGVPPPGKLLVHHSAVGLNFIDTYRRTGLYPGELPLLLGEEGAGTIVAIGEGVTDFAVGQRVYTKGGYASATIADPDSLIALPESISDEIAVAAMTKGLTAEALIFRCAEIKPGETALVTAAAGGTGQILVQWLHAIGVRVIAHASSEEKAAIARAAGADVALHGGYEALAAQVRAATAGEGVHVSFDGVGAASWDASLKSLRRRGLLITFGNASGAVPPFAPLELVQHGSLFVTRPTMGDYMPTPQEKRSVAAHLFEAIQSGTIRINIGQRFALGDVAEAHRALEGRRTTGSTVLIP
jgi:NADPH2:quinone reductase